MTAHAVQFYDLDEQLVSAVGRYLVDGLREGAVAIVIATEPHRLAIDPELESAGLDPAQLRADGSLVMLDAAGTLAAFRPEGRLDRDAFHRVVGSVVRGAAATGRPVLAFGEMVALLWEAGDVGGAIELEKLWNELGEQAKFSLLCGYRSTSVCDPRHAEALEQVCHLHSAVLDAPPAHVPCVVSARFDPDPSAPGGARRLLVDALGGWEPHPDLLSDAQLVVSELASNAVRHARTPFTVTVRCDRAGVEIAVEDTSPAQPVVCDADPDALSGRGLRLIATLAEAWGIEWTAAAKTVWARLQS